VLSVLFYFEDRTVVKMLEHEQSLQTPNLENVIKRKKAAMTDELSRELQTRNQKLAALVARVADGDEAALTELYDATNRQIFGLLLQLIGDAAVAEEVLLDVFMQVWRQAKKYDAARGQPFAWLVVMARSRAIDRLRSDKSAARNCEPLDATLDLAASVNVEDDAFSTEMRRMVQMALNALAPEQREAIELAFYKGLSHSEIADQFNQPLGTIKTRIRRGMMKLREILNPVLMREE
jgi:RNA polymerase sigma-70 factor (ECF subfamily)